VISRADMTSLTWLKMHWEFHYQISLNDGAWQALPVERDTVILSAGSAVKRRDAMKDDFADRAAGMRHGRPGIPEPGAP
jgi:hypothetical protein